MKRRTVFRAAGGMFLPSVLLLSGCPSTCAPAAAPAPAVAPPAQAAAPPAADGTAAPSPNKPPANAQWFEDFTGDTDADFAAEFATETVTVGAEQASPSRTWIGQHNMACAGPDTERVVHPGHEFWLCAPAGPDSEHVMSSAGGSHEIGGYSVVAFSPRRTFSDATSVCWDVNLTEAAGARLWWEVQIVPEAGFRANGDTILYGAFDNNFGEFQRNVPPGSMIWDGKGESVHVSDDTKYLFDPGPDWEDDTVRYVTSDRAKRETNCLEEIGGGQMRLSQTRTGKPTYVKTFKASFPSQFRVIYSAHDYNAGKDGSLANQTWHWDNLTVT